MTTAFFFNCVADTISVNLNLGLSPEIINGRGEAAENQPMVLPMIPFPIVATGAEQGKMSLLDKNLIIISFETLQTSADTYEIQLDKELDGKSLYFYVFEKTLVGQDARGMGDGISISIHKVFQRRVLQTGIADDGGPA